MTVANLLPMFDNVYNRAQVEAAIKNKHLGFIEIHGYATTTTPDQAPIVVERIKAWDLLNEKHVAFNVYLRKCTREEDADRIVTGRNKSFQITDELAQIRPL